MTQLCYYHIRNHSPFFERNHTVNLEQFIPLLGKSERDAQVIAMLSELGMKQPLPRPKQGDDVSYATFKSLHLEFIFKMAERMKNYTKEHLEGELILVNIVYYPTDNDVSDNLEFPFGVKVGAHRKEQFKVLGEPSWRSDDLNMYAWEFDKFKLSLTYKNEGERIYEIAYFLNPKVKI